MTNQDRFWTEPGCAPGMSREQTADYLRQLGVAYGEKGNSAFGEALIANALGKLSTPRPGPNAEQIELWEGERGVKLPATLRDALQVQDGGYVEGTRLLIFRLAEMIPLSRPEWAHLWEKKANREFGDANKLVWIASDESTGGMLILGGNAGPEPRIIWLWRDLGDELRDEGDETFDHMILRLRESNV